jgi:hypothetical protein
MAAPTSVSLSRLDGKYVLNKTLSDSVDSLLALQGISWPIRKAASIATPKISIKSETWDDGVICIEITSAVSGMPGGGSTEKCQLDWSEWEKKDPIIGNYKGKMGLYSFAELPENDFLRGRVVKDGGEGLGWSDGEDAKYIGIVLQSSKNGWTGEHIWGFEIINQERRYTRRMLIKKGEKVELARLVYDYIGIA